MAAVPDQDPVQTLGPNAAHPAFRIRGRTRSPDRSLHDPYAVGRERGVEAGHEFGIPVADQQLDLGGSLPAQWPGCAPAGSPTRRSGEGSPRPATPGDAPAL